MSNRKQILIVAMVGSIHTARWLNQFKNSNYDFHIFPSRRFRKIHPYLRELTKIHAIATFTLHKNPRWIPNISIGYWEYFLEEVLSRKLAKTSKKQRLSNLLSSRKFDIVHLLEIQGAGYLYLEAEEGNSQGNKVILTNWGSDIFYFQKFEDHKIKISRLLKIVDSYSAECERDYRLARNLGFVGNELPCNPNAGGFEIPNDWVSSRDRRIILCKAYGGEFGLGADLIKAAKIFLTNHREFSFHFYSITDDLEFKIKELKSLHPNNVSYSTRRSGLPYNQLQNLFSNSLLYLGASRSDGISTSFLEAIINGAYPIQTNTSCANEWIKKGFMATLIEPLDYKTILNELIKLTGNIEHLAEAQFVNNTLAHKFLSEEVITEKCHLFYS